MRRVLVYGLGITGRCTVRALRARDVDVIVTADRLDDAERDEMAQLGVRVVEAAGASQYLTGVDAVMPAPGVPETHPIIAAARDHACPIRGELEVAYEIEQGRPGGPRPMLAVTGTDGKTTTTLLVAAILEAAGRRPIAAGNTETPLIEAIDGDADVFVVEATSFRLAWTERFRAMGAAWLNLAPDHLNWHVSMATYEAAKARIFRQQHRDDVAVGFVDDPVVTRHLEAAPGSGRTFGLADADYHHNDGELVGPRGRICPSAIMRRRLPHDITNALAASALVLETGLATETAIESALATFTGPPHRLELVGERDGIQWFNDSKATTPHAASVALRAFDQVVLIAGGLNKGLDLAPMAEHADRVRAVIAIGKDAADIESAFAPLTPVLRAESMPQAIERAAGRAERGDVVLLSPGCASFDWYPDGGYEARGADFRRHVEDHLARSENTTRRVSS